MWALAASTSAADRLPELRTTDLCRRRQTAEILIVARPAAGGGPRALRRQGRAPGRARAAPQGRRAGARARPQDLRVGDRGKTVAGVELSVRVARSRDLVAAGYPLSAVARAARISRQALWGAKTRCAPREIRDLEAGRYFWHPTPLRGRLVLGEQPLCERVADELGRNRRTPTPTPSQRSPSPTGGPNCCWARAAWATRPMKMVSGRSSVITIPCSCKSVTGPS